MKKPQSTQKITKADRKQDKHMCVVHVAARVTHTESKPLVEGKVEDAWQQSSKAATLLGMDYKRG